MINKVEIIGLRELRRDLKGSERALDRELSRGLRMGGRPVGELAQALAPKRSGELAGDWHLQSSGTHTEVVFGAEHAPIIEFAGLGRYRSLTERYGPPPRFGHRALEIKQDEVAEIVFREISEVVAARGWFFPGTAPGG